MSLLSLLLGMGKLNEAPTATVYQNSYLLSAIVVPLTDNRETHGFSCNSSEPPEEAREPQLCPAVFTFLSRGGWWLPGNFSMAQSCAAFSMRITGCLVVQCMVLNYNHIMLTYDG